MINIIDAGDYKELVGAPLQSILKKQDLKVDGVMQGTLNSASPTSETKKVAFAAVDNEGKSLPSSCHSNKRFSEVDFENRAKALQLLDQMTFKNEPLSFSKKWYELCEKLHQHLETFNETGDAKQTKEFIVELMNIKGEMFELNAARVQQLNTLKGSLVLECIETERLNAWVKTEEDHLSSINDANDFLYPFLDKICKDLRLGAKSFLQQTLKEREKRGFKKLARDTRLQNTKEADIRKQIADLKNRIKAIN